MKLTAHFKLIYQRHQLLKRFPFLKARNLKTWLDDFPVGWQDTVALPMFEQVRASILVIEGEEKKLNGFVIDHVDIDETSGKLKLNYHLDGITAAAAKSIQLTVEYYRNRSVRFCKNCGKPTTHVINKKLYLCEHCTGDAIMNLGSSLTELRELVPSKN